jgi:hypothetical protein
VYFHTEPWGMSVVVVAAPAVGIAPMPLSASPITSAATMAVRFRMSCAAVPACCLPKWRK